MSSEIILIVGPVLSGKTWLANRLVEAYGRTAKIWDEPNLQDRKTVKEIKLFAAYHGRVIITCCVEPVWPKNLTAWTRLIALQTNV